MRGNIFEPLGMETASFRVKDLANAADHATGYRLDDQENPVPLRYLNVDSLGPAGAINASAADLSRYLLMLVNGGKFGDKTILATSDLNEMTSPQMIVPGAPGYREFGSSSYGMGFRVTTYRGRKLVNHGGALRGLASLLSFLPDEKIGVYAAANCSGSSLPGIVTYAAFDRLLDLEPIDWSARFRKDHEKERAARLESKAAQISTKISGTSPARGISEYAGDYEHPAYGTFKFRENNGQLEGTFNGARSLFEHYHFETFRAPENSGNSRSGEKAQFITSIDGDIESVAVQLEPTVAPIIFKRTPDTSLNDPEFLQKLVGQYEVASSRVRISLRADHRLLYTAGGQTRELYPIRGGRFSVQDRPGHILEFIADENGEYKKLYSHTPAASTIGNRLESD